MDYFLERTAEALATTVLPSESDPASIHSGKGSTVKIEHVALQVPDSLAMARWYVEHLGLTVKMRGIDPPYGHFLADDGDAVMLEIFSFSDVTTPSYGAQDPRQLHLAFTSHDVAADVKRLEAAGAVPVSGPETTPSGDTIAMLRDPWGVCVQLVRRAKPMLPQR